MHRPHAAVLVQPVARLELGGTRDQLLHQRVVRAFLHIQALGRKALLAAVEEPPDRDRPGGALEVGVVEHDARVAAAELERDLLQGFGCFRHHALAGRRRPGERDLPDQGVPDDRLTGRLAEDDVDDSLGQTAIDERLDARQGRQGCGARGLEDHGVARRDRRRDLVRRQRQRKVPRHDRTAHADRLAHDEAVRREVGEADVLAVNLVRQVSEPADVLTETSRFQSRLEQCLALLLGEDGCDLLDLRQHVLRGLVQDLATLVGGQFRPGPERFRCGLGGLVDVGGPAGRNLVDDLAGGRVANLVRLAGRGLGPVTLDDHGCHLAPPVSSFLSLLR